MIGFTVFKLTISALAGYALTQSLVSAGLFLADESSLIVLTVVFAMILYAVVDRLLPLMFALAGAALLFIALAEMHVPVVPATRANRGQEILSLGFLVVRAGARAL